MEEYRQLKDTLKKMPSFQDPEKGEGGNEQPEVRGPSPQSRAPEQHGAGAEQQHQVKGFTHPRSGSDYSAKCAQCLLGVCVWLCTFVSLLEESSEEWFNR